MNFVDGKFVINEEEVFDVFKSALTKLYKNDRFLIDNDVHEQAIAHRFAIYLREDLLFAEKNGLRVDVEYNRDGENGETKRDKEKEPFRPDIILHERGSREIGYRNDIIICEIKKDSQHDQKDATKIKEQMEQRCYQFGIDMYLINKDESQFNLYTSKSKSKPRTYQFDPKSSKLEEL